MYTAWFDRQGIINNQEWKNRIFLYPAERMLHCTLHVCTHFNTIYHHHVAGAHYYHSPSKRPDLCQFLYLTHFRMKSVNVLCPLAY